MQLHISLFKSPLLIIAITASLWMAPCEKARGQSYSLKIEALSFEVDSFAISGYATHFLQPYQDVKKAWWRYIKSRAIIFNKVTHYELKVISKGERIEPVMLASKLELSADEKRTTLMVGLFTHNIDDTEVERTMTELRQMLLDFKVSFYVNPLQKEIKDKEKEATQLSTKIYKLQHGRPPKQLTEDEADSLAEVLEYQLLKVNQNLDSLKGRLTQIK